MQADRRQQRLELEVLADHDRLAIVFGEVVPKQVVDAIAPRTARDPLPFKVSVGHPYEPDEVVTGTAARAVRPGAEIKLVVALASDEAIVAVATQERVGRVVADKEIPALPAFESLQAAQRVSFAWRPRVAICARKVGDHSAPTAFVAERVDPEPAIKHVALGRHGFGGLEQGREEAPVELLRRPEARQSPVPKGVIAVISLHHVSTLTGVERIREGASHQSVVAAAAVDVHRNRGAHRVAAVARKDEGHETRSARWTDHQLPARQRAARPCARRRPRVRDLKLSSRPTRDAQTICLAGAGLDDEPLAIVRRALRPGAVKPQELETNLGRPGHRDLRSGERNRYEGADRTDPSQGHPSH